MKKILISGISGFLGNALRRTLIENEFDVYGITRSQQLIENNVFYVDWFDQTSLKGIVGKIKPDIVFHLSADKSRSNGSIESFRNSIETNLIGTLNFVESLLESTNLEKFIFVGTCEEYGEASNPVDETKRENPVSSYSYSKTATVFFLQTLAKTHNFPSVILRPSLIYGPGQKDDMFLNQLIEVLLKGLKFEMSSGDQTRDFLYIDDFISACLAVLNTELSKGQILNIGSGNSIRIKDVATLVASFVSKEAAKNLILGAKPNRSNEIMNYNTDISLAKKILSWQPSVGFAEGILKTVEFKRNWKGN